MRKNQSKYEGLYKKGDVFGNWTIISDELFFVKDESNGRRRAKVKVKCSCGTEHLLRPDSLNKDLQGCYECTRAKPGSDNPSWKGVGNLCSLEYSRLKRQANQRNIKFSITKEYIWELFESQNGNCALTNVKIDLVPTYYIKRGQKQTASLDRIDSNKGYIKGNVHWVHKDINVMKNGYNIEYFIKMCKAVADNTKEIDVSEAVSNFVFGNPNH
jgi:hypothetical protein